MSTVNRFKSNPHFDALEVEVDAEILHGPAQWSAPGIMVDAAGVRVTDPSLGHRWIVTVTNSRGFSRPIEVPISDGTSVELAMEYAKIGQMVSDRAKAKKANSP